MRADEPGRRGSSTRRDPRALLVVAAALLVTRIALGFYENAHQPKLLERVIWQPIASADSLSRATGKPILYDFTADWCAPCHMMSREVFADRRSAHTINQLFIPVRVLDRQREEGRNRPEVSALQARFKVQSFPTLVVVTPGASEPVVLAGFSGRQRTLRELMGAVAGLRLRAPPGAGPPDRGDTDAAEPSER